MDQQKEIAMLHFLQLFRPSPFPSLAGISFRLFFSFVGFFIILAFALVLSLSALVNKGLPTCHCPVAADPATAVLPFQPRLFPPCSTDVALHESASRTRNC